MDRCRCEDYAAAVRKLRFYTVGTFRPDLIDNYDRTGYAVDWIKKGVSYDDMKFERARARKAAYGRTDKDLSDESRRLEQMWCPYMTPIKK